MNEMRWEKLTEVYGRMDADVLKSYLEASGIQVETFQEAVGHHIYPTTVDGLARVQLFVPREAIEQAREVLAAYQAGGEPPSDKEEKDE
jgi:hypothetical protein